MRYLPMPEKNLLKRGFYIRRACLNDIVECDRIARQYPAELAFVRKASLARGIENGSLYVAVETNEQIRGFVLFHRRRDGWQTVYDLAVDIAYTGLGIGRQLLYAVPCPVQLKCKIDNVRANAFYQHAGMVLSGEAEARSGARLNVWKRQHLFVFCAGNNKTHPSIAAAAGMAYGTAQKDTPVNWPFMFDVEFLPDAQDWPDFMQKIAAYRPVMALATDYMCKSEKQRMLSQVNDLRAAGILRIVVCPKFLGAIDDIPDDCVIGISAITKSEKFGGWHMPLSDIRKMRGRRAHILGGTPHVQTALIDRVKLYGGTVISLDGNSHQRAAMASVVWKNNRWYRSADRCWEYGDYENTLLVSSKNIVAYINDRENWISGSPTIRRKRVKQRQLRLF